jgi:hypothetical protein
MRNVTQQVSSTASCSTTTALITATALPLYSSVTASLPRSIKGSTSGDGAHAHHAAAVAAAAVHAVRDQQRLAQEAFQVQEQRCSCASYAV